MVKEWFGFSERRLIQIHEVDQQNSRAFAGRAAGPKSKVVPLISVWEKYRRRSFQGRPRRGSLMLRCEGKLDRPR
eukprot:432196-Pyramimonas_sp.AAC.1